MSTQARKSEQHDSKSTLPDMLCRPCSLVDILSPPSKVKGDSKSEEERDDITEVCRGDGGMSYF